MIRALYLVSLVLLVATGCNGITKRPFAKAIEPTVETAGEATLSRLLGDPVQVPLVEGRRDLRSVFESQSNDEVLRIVKKRIKESALVIPEDRLVEDIVVLQREGEYWYFPRTWLATDEIGGIALVDRDLVFGLSFRAVQAFQNAEERPDKLEVVFSGAESKVSGTQELTPIQGTLSAVVKYSPVKWSKEFGTPEVEVAVISRFDRGNVHHLVLPVSVTADGTWISNSMISTVRGKKFRTRDNVILARLSQLRAIFPE